MKKFIGIVVAALLAASCQSMIASTLGFSQEDPGYSISSGNIGENRALAKFYGRAFLVEREDERAAVRMREPIYNGIPDFGYLSVLVQGWTAGTASPSLIIVRDDSGKELYRGSGRPTRPSGSVNDLGDHYNTTWKTVSVITLEEEPVFPLSVRVVLQTDDYVVITVKKK